MATSKFLWACLHHCDDLTSMVQAYLGIWAQYVVFVDSNVHLHVFGYSESDVLERLYTVPDLFWYGVLLYYDPDAIFRVVQDYDEQQPSSLINQQTVTKEIRHSELGMPLDPMVFRQAVPLEQFATKVRGKCLIYPISNTINVYEVRAWGQYSTHVLIYLAPQ